MISRTSFSRLSLLLIAILALSGCGPSELSLPKQTHDKVILKPGGAEQVRFVDTKPDGSSVVRIEYSDNRTAISTYRANKTLAEVNIWYPAAKDSTVRQLQRHAVYETDGKTYVSNVEYYPDGKLLRQGTNFGGSTIFESYSFAPDGKTVARHQRFVKKDKWIADLDQSYAANGAVISTLALQSDNSTTITTFTDKGVKTSEAKADALGSTITTQFFYPDGVTVYKLMEQGPSTVTLTLKRFDGTNIVRREISSGSMTVAYFTEKGEPAYKQTFTVDKVQTPDGGSVKRYRLTYAAESDTQNNTLRSVYTADDGTTPKTVSIYHQPTGSGRVEKTFAKDGTLAKVEVYDGNGKIIATTIHTPSENLRESLPAKLMEQEGFDRPPAPTGVYPFNPYSMYGDY
ncbi:hypothetical protein BH10CYA1_BH10CYA1_38470 [soil metagenome]